MLVHSSPLPAWIYPISANQSPMHGHLGCFQFFLIISNAPMNILGSTALPAHGIFLGKFSGSLIACTKAIHILHFEKCPQVSFPKAIPMYSPTKPHWRTSGECLMCMFGCVPQLSQGSTLLGKERGRDMNSHPVPTLVYFQLLSRQRAGRSVWVG